MKITIYTVNNCDFSKAEKEYLKAHNQAFDEKNLETNKEFLTEMLTLSNNFTGTPVTKVEKDDGQISILKGFTKEEFDKAMGYSQPKETVVNSTINAPATSPKPTTPPATPPITTPSAPAPVAAPSNDPLNAVLNNLQTKAEEPVKAEAPAAPTTPAPATTAPVNPPSNLPNVPDFPK